MGATPNYGLPYPAESDDADVPLDMGELALALDNVIVGKTIVDAKGDLIAATGADAVTRLARGTDGQVLSSDAASPAGLKWIPLGGAYVPVTDKGVANGVATLDAGGKVPVGQLPPNASGTIYDAKGDILAASGPDVPARLPVGTDGQVLAADSTQSTGLKWVPQVAPGGGIPATIVDAKGDLIAATAPDTVARLPVGTDGQILTADSAQASGVKWGPPPGSASTQPLPIDLRNPSTLVTYVGNAFPQVAALSNWEEWHWEFTKDVDGYIYGLVRVPAGFTAPKVVISTLYNAAAGVASWVLAWAKIADGGSANPALIPEARQDVAVPGTARTRKDVTFTLAGGAIPATGDLLIVQIWHNGAHANDTVAVNSELLGAWLLPS